MKFSLFLNLTWIPTGLDNCSNCVDDIGRCIDEPQSIAMTEAYHTELMNIIAVHTRVMTKDQAIVFAVKVNIYMINPLTMMECSKNSLKKHFGLNALFVITRSPWVTSQFKLQNTIFVIYASNSEGP